MDRAPAPRLARLLVWVLALFPWIDAGLRLGVPRLGLGLGQQVGRGWDEVFLAVCLGWVGWALLRRRRVPALPRPVAISLLLFAVAAVASLVAGGVPPAVGLDAVRVTFQPMLFGLVAMVLLEDPARRGELVDLVVVSGVAIALAGIVQYAGRFESPRWLDKPTTEQFRVVSIFANPNALGGYLAMVLAFALPGAWLSPPGRRRVAYLGACAVLGAALALTFSRGAWVGCAAAGLLLTVLLGLARRRWLWAAAAGTAVVLLLAPGEVGERLAELFDPAYYLQSARYGRLAFWSRALDAIAERPLFGTGLGMFGGSVALRHGVAGATWVDNHYLKLGAETGLVGLAGFVALLAAVLAAAVEAQRRAAGRRERAMALGVAGTVVAIALQSATAGVLDALYVGVHFWTLAGLLFALPASAPAAEDGG